VSRVATLPATRRVGAMPSRPSLRVVATRDAEATRQRILAAAVAEFSGKGLAGGRVDAIAKAARTNKRMLYYYFGDKEGLYLAALEQAYVDLRRQEAELDLKRLPPREAITRLCEFKFDYFVRHPALIGLLTVENVHGARYLKRSKRLRELHVSLVETLAGLLRAGESEGAFRRGVDPVQLYLSIAALSYFYFSNRATLSTAFGRDLGRPQALAARRAHVVEVIQGYLRPERCDA